MSKPRRSIACGYIHKSAGTKRSGGCAGTSSHHTAESQRRSGKIFEADEKPWKSVEVIAAAERAWPACACHALLRHARYLLARIHP